MKNNLLMRYPAESYNNVGKYQRKYYEKVFYYYVDVMFGNE